MTATVSIDANQLELAIAQVRAARQYTLTLLEGVPEDGWFWTPTAPITHIAWQLGHIAVAQYGLMLFRQRGRLPTDADLMSSDFRKLFMKGTNASAERSNYPSPQEIRTVLDAVHRQALDEAARFDPDDLSQPTEPPHAAFPNRLGSLLFASAHEMLHAGQIGLLRRLMGLSPIR